MWSRTIAVVLCSTAATVATASAQSRGVELGIDGGFSYKVNDPTVFQIDIPISRFRVGFMVSDHVSVEPAIEFDMIKVEGEDAVTALGAQLGLLYHFSADATTSQAFFHPFAGISWVDFGAGSASQFHAGGGLGVKLPVASQLAVRLEAGFQYAFESDDFDKATSIFALIGFSFRTR